MRLATFILITKAGQYILHFSSGKPKEITFEEFIAEVRKDDWLPVYKEIA